MNIDSPIFDGLYLHYKFTDRGGSRVFEIYPASDMKQRTVLLGTIRISSETAASVAWRANEEAEAIRNDKPPIQLTLNLEGKDHDHD